MGKDVNFLKSVKNFLSSTYQRVALNSQASPWTDAKVSVPQGYRSFIYSYSHQ